MEENNYNSIQNQQQREEEDNNYTDEENESTNSQPTYYQISYELLMTCTHHKKPRGEPVEQFLSRLTHLALNNKGLTKVVRILHCKDPIIVSPL